MTASSLLFALLFYAAGAVLVGGLAARIAGYARTPAPLKIPSTPAPRSRGGVALRLAREVALAVVIKLLVIAAIVTAVPPVLVSVNACGEPAAPTVCVPNA